MDCTGPHFGGHSPDPYPYDPVIFGKIIDGYAQNAGVRTEKELVQGVLFWLSIAVGIALVARLIMAFKEYIMRMVVQKFGMQIFNDGLRQTLRLPFMEFEDSSSGELLAILQKVRNDTERFLSSSINILFPSVVGIGFLIWYAFTKRWVLIEVFIIGLVFLGGLTSLLSRSIKTLQRALIRQTRAMSGTIMNCSTGRVCIMPCGVSRSEKGHRQSRYVRQKPTLLLTYLYVSLSCLISAQTFTDSNLPIVIISTIHPGPG